MDKRIKVGSWARIINTDRSGLPNGLMNNIVFIRSITPDYFSLSYSVASIWINPTQRKAINSNSSIWNVYIEDLRAF